MITYKYLDADLKIIQQEVNRYITTYDDYQIGFTKLPIAELLDNVTYFTGWFKSLSCEPTSVYLIRTPHGSSKQNAHVDNWVEKSTCDRPKSSKYVLAINIPISNTENTCTEFYEYIDGPVKNLEFGSFGIVYQYYGKSNLKKIDSYSLVKPVILNTSIPHSVINNTEKDRFALTFRFESDPWHLIS